MNTHETQQCDRSAHGMDLSKPWVMHIGDVAKLLGIKQNAVRQRVKRRTIAVMPRNGGDRDKLEWSSLDWWKWFNGTKK